MYYFIAPIRYGQYAYFYKNYREYINNMKINQLFHVANILICCCRHASALQQFNCGASSYSLCFCNQLNEAGRGDLQRFLIKMSAIDAVV